jgi:formate dehydrogenase iron-sulfur subunit
MSIDIYVPRDSSALSLGAESVAQAIAAEGKKRGIDLRIIRNGSRGMYWLEPLVEVTTAGGRVAYGPVTVKDVPGLFDAGFHTGGKHALGHGVTDELQFLKSQQRLTFQRVGIVDPVSVADYVANGGYQGLKQALALSQATIVQQVLDSGLRGRGGAAFPTGI